MTTILGVDIGGANLKAASAGVARLQPFALWRQPQQLPDALRQMVSELPGSEVLAVTMTGELCDCFATRRDGVHAILDAVEQVAAGKPVQVWTTGGRFTDIATARRQPLTAAAANWLALAVFAGRFAPTGAALLIDVGSTTTDIVPLAEGQPVPQGRTDTERLHCAELVYTGVRRTPVCALLGGTVMAELFATTLDAYLLLGDLPESEACDTADGRPATRAYAHARLARMIGGDAESCTAEETLVLARQAVSVQQSLVQFALRRVRRALPASPGKFILSGSGEFLARQVLDRDGVPPEQIMSLQEHLGPALSEAACAHAVAVLAAEGCHA
jgi:probable H4MPT-linked C1 transfer pathway protein